MSRYVRMNYAESKKQTPSTGIYVKLPDFTKWLVVNKLWDRILKVELNSADYLQMKTLAIFIIDDGGEQWPII